MFLPLSHSFPFLSGKKTNTWWTKFCNEWGLAPVTKQIKLPTFFFLALLLFGKKQPIDHKVAEKIPQKRPNHHEMKRENLSMQKHDDIR